MAAMGRAASLNGDTKTTRVLLLLMAFAVSWTSSEVQAPEELTPPPAQSPVDGLAGFSSRSKLACGEDEKQAIRLHCVFVFPDRARINRVDAAGQWSSEYRFGQSLFLRGPEPGSSIPLSPEERGTALLQLALRQAVMLWPQTFAWEREGASLRAKVDSAGSLRASLGPDGRPVQIMALDAEGRTAFMLDSLTWREHSGRTWPECMLWWQEGRRIGLETIESASTSVGYIDSYFLPQDRRPLNSTASTNEEVVLIRVGPFAERREALRPTPSWAQLCASIQDRVALEEQLLREVGFDLGVEAAVEIGEEGQPAAMLLRAFGRAQTMPEGWQVVEAYDALASYAANFEGLGPSLRRLRAKLASTGKNRPVHARWALGECPPSKIQLVQPLTGE